MNIPFLLLTRKEKHMFFPLAIMFAKGILYITFKAWQDALLLDLLRFSFSRLKKKSTLLMCNL